MQRLLYAIWLSTPESTSSKDSMSLLVILTSFLLIGVRKRRSGRSSSFFLIWLGGNPLLEALSLVVCNFRRKRLHINWHQCCFWEHFYTDRFHCLNVISIQGGDFPASFLLCLVGKSRQINRSRCWYSASESHQWQHDGQQ